MTTSSGNSEAGLADAGSSQATSTIFTPASTPPTGELVEQPVIEPLDLGMLQTSDGGSWPVLVLSKDMLPEAYRSRFGIDNKMPVYLFVRKDM